MNRSSLAILLTVVVTACAPLLAVTHHNETSVDAFAACAAVVFKKPVFSATSWIPLGPSDCAATKDEVIANLARKRIDWWDGGSAVFVRIARDYLEAKWSRLELKLRVVNAGLAGGRALSKDELDVIARAVYRGVRPPLLAPGGYDVERGTSRIDVVLSVDARYLRPDAESIVAVWGQEHGVARLAYGEMRSGHFELVWDSPLLKAFFWGIGYEDLDGDGVKEIVFRSNVTPQGRFYTIFDLLGRELSRQRTCNIESSYDEASAVCPIFCDGIDIQPAARDGKRDIVVFGKSDAPNKNPVRMRLASGHLVTVETSSSRQQN